MADELFSIPTASLPTCSLGQRPSAVLRFAAALRVTAAARVGALMVSGRGTSVPRFARIRFGLRCQSARNVDPLSASNIHPPVDDQRLACPALAGVAEGRPSAGDGYLRL